MATKKTYRVVIEEQSSGEVEVKRVEVQKPITDHRSKYVPADKRKFVRGYLNTVDNFTTR
tara:strand:+ start:396 stop:575 length:180 start_codon:yes stop_codon:yes gene_type:complete